MTLHGEVCSVFSDSEPSAHLIASCQGRFGPCCAEQRQRHAQFEVGHCILRDIVYSLLILIHGDCFTAAVVAWFCSAACWSQLVKSRLCQVCSLRRWQTCCCAMRCFQAFILTLNMKKTRQLNPI